ncbi:hypothetical protein VP1G_11229 [Cytospora mali]|uniref:Uncharacterized protein n=1 Tax=Cytospora mali TaxID=578113 RepID=A0A194VAE4_CYTMA|nr:hypothetical protein VP1G_11229 [Valsa mali var. pyri (nom. inval.)]
MEVPNASVNFVDPPIYAVPFYNIAKPLNKTWRCEHDHEVGALAVASLLWDPLPAFGGISE